MKQGMRCPHCGFVTFANREVCPKCNRSPDAKPTPFDLLGRLKKIPKPSLPRRNRGGATAPPPISEPLAETPSAPAAATPPPVLPAPEAPPSPISAEAKRAPRTQAAKPAGVPKKAVQSSPAAAVKHPPAKKTAPARPAPPDLDLLPPLHTGEGELPPLQSKSSPKKKPAKPVQKMPPFTPAAQAPLPAISAAPRPQENSAILGSNLPPIRTAASDPPAKPHSPAELPPLSTLDGFSAPLQGSRSDEELFPPLSETASFHEALPSSFRTPGVRPLQPAGGRRSEMLARQTSSAEPLPQEPAQETPSASAPPGHLKDLLLRLDHMPHIVDGARAAALVAPLLALAGSSTLFGFTVAGIPAEQRSWWVIALLGMTMCTPYAWYWALVWRFFRMGKWLIPAGLAGSSMLLATLPLFFSGVGSLGLFWLVPLLQWGTVIFLAGAPKISSFSNSSAA